MVRFPIVGKTYRIKGYAVEYNGLPFVLTRRNGEYCYGYLPTNLEIELELYRNELEEIE